LANFLVTGGAGFIGSHIVDELLRRGERVRVLDNFSTGRRENLPASDHVEGIEGDIRDPAAVKAAMQGVDYVLHQAALPSVPRSVADPLTSSEVNVTGTLNVLIAARDAGVKRVVYASSSSVYGNSPTLPKREDMSTNPFSPYAVSKLAGENYCRAFHQVYGLPTVALRYFNVFGPRQDPTSQYSAVIPKFIASLLHGEPPTIYGDGTQSRDFTYVANVVGANLLACEKEEAIGQVMNVACGERYTLLDLCHELAALTGKTLQPTFAPPRGGDVKHSMGAIERAMRLLGYRPIVDWREGLRRTVEWYVDSVQVEG
jgi:nucleoside-diphosphate-sugar epimerase